MLLAIGRPHEVAHGSLRLSLCEWNTEEDVDHILKEVPPDRGVPAEHFSRVEGSCQRQKQFML